MLVIQHSNPRINKAVEAALQGKLGIIRRTKEWLCEERFHEFMQEFSNDISMEHDEATKHELVAEFNYWDEHSPGSHVLYRGVRNDTARECSMELDDSFHRLFNQVM